MHKTILLPALLLGFLLSSCRGERPAAKKSGPKVREFWLTSQPTDQAEPDPFSQSVPSLFDVIEHLGDATSNKNVKGLFLRIGNLPGAWGRVDDLRTAITTFKKDGRPVQCHFEATDNVGYLLMAEVCDRISMTSAGTLNLVGPAAQMLFVAPLLKSLGVKAEILHMGRFKGAGDMFTRDTPSPEALQSMNGLLDGMQGALVAAVQKRVGGDAKSAQAVIDRGPFVSSAARELKLVDDVGYDDEAREHARAAAKVNRVERQRLSKKPEELRVGDVLDALGGKKSNKKTKGKHIALAFVTGSIVDGDKKARDKAASGPFVRAFRGFANNDDVQAVVIRINSPGGSALASDRMWHAIRKVAARKPVIVSVSDMAASGGYYIASAGHEIFAHPNSIVGSIGVVGGKFNTEGLAEKIGINTTVLKRGKNSTWSSLLDGFTASEEKAFQALLRDTYHRFIRRVATGREMPEKDVLKAASGRVMTGTEGKQLGLVDTLDGLSAALTRARELAKIGKEVPVVTWPVQKDWLEVANEMLSGGDNGVRAQVSVERALLQELEALGVDPFQATALRHMLKTEHVAAIAPFVFSVY